MIKQQTILYLKTLHCLHETHEAGHDSVYMYIYGDGKKIGRYPESTSDCWHMHSGDSDRVDITINCTYLDKLEVHLYERDQSYDDPTGNDEDLGIIAFTRKDTPSGTKDVWQPGSQNGHYSLDYRVITDPIPSVRILAIKCETQSAGLNIELVEKVTEKASDVTDAAGNIIKKSPRPRAKAVGKAFEAASEVLMLISGFAEQIGHALEGGEDDVYMKHEDASRAQDGGFFPPDKTAYQMKSGDSVCFEQTYGHYFRFPLDEGTVKIGVWEHDPNSSEVDIGKLTVTPDGLSSGSSTGIEATTVNGGVAVMDGPAVVEMTIAEGRREGEGAIYHICYSVGMEDWSLPATTADQMDPAEHNGGYKNPAHGTNTYWGVQEHIGPAVLTIAEMRAVIQSGIPKDEGWPTNCRYWTSSSASNSSGFSINIQTGEVFPEDRGHWCYYTWRLFPYEYKNPTQGTNTYPGAEDHAANSGSSLPSLAEMQALVASKYCSDKRWPTGKTYWVLSDRNAQYCSTVELTTGQRIAYEPKNWQNYTWKVSGDAPVLADGPTRSADTQSTPIALEPGAALPGTASDPVSSDPVGGDKKSKKEKQEKEQQG